MRRSALTAGFLLSAAAFHLAAAAQTDEASREWSLVAPGGNTRCSDGTPYRFLVRPGNPAKLHFHLQGGGGCWRRENCDPAMQPTYFINTESLEPPSDGVFDSGNPDNPLADYTVVFAAYCSGDIHLGASDTVYPPVTAEQEPLTIYHRGRANVESALQWTYQHVAAPEKIFVSGSSAGALPSPLYASLLADHYGGAQVAHLGDAAGGYLFDTPDLRPRDTWGTFAFLPTTPGFEAIEADAFSYERLYIAAARAHPEILFTRYDTAEDEAQKRFLAMRGVIGVSLLDSLRANNGTIHAAVPNFRAYVAGGELHTILERPEFYSVIAREVRIRDWVAMLEQHQQVEDVECQDCAETQGTD